MDAPAPLLEGLGEVGRRGGDDLDLSHPEGLSETVVEGISTNVPLHQELMVDANFITGGTNIHYLEEWLSQHKR